MAATVLVSKLRASELDVLPPVMILVAWSNPERHPKEGLIPVAVAAFALDEAEPTWEDAEWQLGALLSAKC